METSGKGDKEAGIKLANAPIVEAVLDIDCDLPPDTMIEELENPGRQAFCDHYPKVRKRYFQEHRITPQRDQSPETSVRTGIKAFHFVQEDGKQLVQIRTEGYSFNRLAPYTTLDDYLPEIQRTWKLFIQIAFPVQIRCIRLRYINRIPLPIGEGRIELSNYFTTAPRLPDEEELTLTGFLHQHAAIEKSTDNQVSIVLTALPPQGDILPVILDIGTSKAAPEEPENWSVIVSTIQSLRNLKNRIFANTLTGPCLNLFR